MKRFENVKRDAQSALDAMFAPTSIAVIGATDRPGSVSKAVMVNLLAARFPGPIYPVNAKRDTVIGIRCYRTVTELPPVDLAVIVTPASTVADVVEQCGAHEIPAALIISAGFKEAGPEGAALEARVAKAARVSGIRIIGPNCLGIINPRAHLNASFAATNALTGNVAFLSQSGALCTAVLDWSLRERVGFSAFVSAGSMLDVHWGDLIRYFGDDPKTACLLLYIESVGDARSFLSAAREAALKKAIIVLKAGRSEESAKATISHTGSLAGSDDVFEAALGRCGVLRVNTIAELFYMAECLSRQPRPEGPRLAIVTNAGGPAVLATDALVTSGGEVAKLSSDSLNELSSFLPSHWSGGNPIDVLGDATPQTIARAVDVVARDAEADGILVILAPQAMTDPTATAEQIVKHAQSKKPILASWMGGDTVAAGEAILNRSGVPTFPYPDTAARAFTFMWQYTHNIQGLYQTPILVPNRSNPLEDIETFLARIRASGRTILTETESKYLLIAYGIPSVRTIPAHDEAAAIRAAADLGFPVAVKLHSETITHKTEVDGVRLGLRDASDVEGAFRSIRKSVADRAGIEHFGGVTVQPMRSGGYELLLGSSVDPQFGPVIVFGTGGQLVEVYRDRALALPPLNTTLADRLIAQTRIAAALKGVRGRRPVNMHALRDLIVRFSNLVAEQPTIREIDINPILATEDEVVALDARIVLYPEDADKDGLPRLAIRPYPNDYESVGVLPDGREIRIRPLRAEDEPSMVAFHNDLSEETVRGRYLGALNLQHRISHERLTKVCCVDYNKEIPLIAVLPDPQRIVGVCRLIKEGEDSGEFALLVSDFAQHQGIGTILMRALILVARNEGIESIHGWIHPDNVRMQRFCSRLGFTLQPGDGLYDASLNVREFPKHL